MNYSKLVTVIGCAVVLGQATALESRHQKTYREWDKNKDKKLTKAELPVQNQRNFNAISEIMASRVVALICIAMAVVRAEIEFSRAYEVMHDGLSAGRGGTR